MTFNQTNIDFFKKQNELSNSLNGIENANSNGNTISNLMISNSNDQSGYLYGKCPQTQVVVTPTGKGTFMPVTSPKSSTVE